MGMTIKCPVCDREDSYDEDPSFMILGQTFCTNCGASLDLLDTGPNINGEDGEMPHDN
jgi:hypothetical protein